MHVGSDKAITLPKVYIEKKKKEDSSCYIYNSTQRQLYQEWKKMCNSIGRVDLVVINGDICDGVNPKAKGLGTWTCDLSLQVNTAADLLKMIHTNKYAATQGSFYHIGDNISTDKAVMMHEKINGVFGSELSIKADDVRFHFSHSVGISTSGWMYRTTPIAREMMLSALVRDEMGKYDVICRGHAHYFCYAGFANSLGIITPGWKSRDDYAQRRTLAFVPHCGYVLFEVDGDSYRWRKHIFTIEKDNLVDDIVIT